MARRGLRAYTSYRSQQHADWELNAIRECHNESELTEKLLTPDGIHQQREIKGEMWESSKVERDSAWQKSLTQLTGDGWTEGWMDGRMDEWIDG